jgi:hypothetical protein
MSDLTVMAHWGLCNANAPACRQAGLNRELRKLARKNRIERK